MTDRRAELARARDYPYGNPGRSFTWRGGAVGVFDPESRQGRMPVLAIGSNQSPEQLTRKFGDTGEIPVQRAWLRDFDVCYSAHVTRYGAVPAMLQRAPGTVVSLAVTWLDEAQLAIMHDSETAAANYEFAAIEGVSLVLDCGIEMDTVPLYVGLHGHLVAGGAAIPLSAIGATGRHGAAMTTGQVLDLVRRRVAPDEDSGAFVLRLIDDDDFRAACTERIAADAVPFGYPVRKLAV